VALPKVEIAGTSVQKGDAIVLGFFCQERDAEASSDAKKEFKLEWVASKSKDREFQALLELLETSKHFSAKKAEVSVLRFRSMLQHDSAILFGLGPVRKWSAETARSVGGVLFQVQKREKFARLTLHFESFFGKTKPTELEPFVQAFFEGYYLASYDFVAFKGKGTPNSQGFVPKGLTVEGGDATLLKRILMQARVLAEAVHFARSLGDAPGNSLTPTEIARRATEMCKGRKLKCTVFGESQLRKFGMGLFLGVSQGSDEEPKMIQVEYRGGRKGDAPVALIGKGVTFDSGGISLKPAAQMEDMKYDMMGAAAVLATIQAAADLSLPVNVVAYVGASENLPGGNAQKPGDIQTSYTGKTVEIVNTDAEGRLILADVIEYCQAHSKPAAMLDVATLTGACVVALGSIAAGVMGTHSALMEAVKHAALETGERVWELPLYEEYEEDLKSAYADIRNSGSRDAGASKGGAFLKFFVEPKMPWVHLDIAGPAYFRKDLSYASARHASGFGVRLLTQLLKDWKGLHKESSS
jgi:leucyl aminopeptidase